jgi:hypothetical protein
MCADPDPDARAEGIAKALRDPLLKVFTRTRCLGGCDHPYYPL